MNAMRTGWRVKDDHVMIILIDTQEKMRKCNGFVDIFLNGVVFFFSIVLLVAVGQIQKLISSWIHLLLSPTGFPRVMECLIAA